MSGLVQAGRVWRLDAFRTAAEHEHVRLKDQIEELKHSLEQAQLHRKRKQEYDIIAEKINALPSRDELEEYVPARHIPCSAF